MRHKASGRGLLSALQAQVVFKRKNPDKLAGFYRIESKRRTFVPLKVDYSHR